MTKKEFIWLGVRTIGFYWLIRLINAILALMWLVLWSTGFLGLSETTDKNQSVIIPGLISSLIRVPLPLLLSVYFLFFGTLVYQLVNRFASIRQEDLTQPTGYRYCEIIIRFIGLWVLGMLVYQFYNVLMLYVRSVLMYHFVAPDNPINPFKGALRQFSGIDWFLLLLFHLTLQIIAAWYFLKKGNFFINLLNRLWLKITDQNPVHTV